ncbi:hypothetical protein AVDCRST_MAG81-4430 [uncultured Synechococcales cyanobacterium]|uniref:Uncharacterized protein n=1 Tax=uncultured Synechococcales cyanobacterium TaxID=1936017 RepID=A0A6J4VRX5_9CYAN|nr:hypothetical protein AVDCRST_MAG81-4430 [uncultured Synechococcales cyanobacterium]
MLKLGEILINLLRQKGKIDRLGNVHCQNPFYLSRRILEQLKY